MNSYIDYESMKSYIDYESMNLYNYQIEKISFDENINENINERIKCTFKDCIKIFIYTIFMGICMFFIMTILCYLIFIKYNPSNIL